MSAFFWKKLAFFSKNIPLLKAIVWGLRWKFFSSVFSFVIKKITVTENVTFAVSMSGIQPPDCSKLAKNPKNGNDITILWHDVKVKYFWRCFVFLVKFSSWSKFHVNIITGSGIMTIFFYKGLTRNPEIGNTPSQFCPISGDWCKLWIPNLERMSLIEYCWMLQNSKVTAFTVFELLRENYGKIIKGKLLWGAWGKITPSLTEIRVKKRCCDIMQQICRRTLMRRCDFKKVALQILLKLHYGMGVLRQICCIISQHLFLRTPLDGCFWIILHFLMFWQIIYMDCLKTYQ